MIIVRANQLCVVGRYRTWQDHLEFDWPGTEVRLSFTGSTRVGVWMDGGGAYYNVSFVGYHRKMATHKGMHYYALVEGLDSQVLHTIRLQRRSDAVLCDATSRYTPTLVHGFRLDASASIPMQPPFTHPRRIELVGDSDLAGFGVDADKPTPHNSLVMYGDLQDADKSFGALVARQTGSEYHCIAWSGKGVCRQTLFMGRDHLPDLYERCVASRPDSRVPPSVWRCELGLIYCGSNDWLHGVEMSEFVHAYSRLITLVSQRCKSVVCLTMSNPQSLSCVPSSEAQRVCRNMRRGVELAVKRFKNVHHIDLWVDTQMPQDFAMNSHWSASGHRKIAEQLAPQLLL